MAANNKETVKQIYKAMNSGNFEGLENYIAADMVEHSPDPMVPSTSKGPEYVGEVIRHYKNAFPDLRINVLDMVEENNKVVAHIEITGTHSGELMGKAPTNKQFKIEGFDMAKFADGKVTDHWGVWDYAALMQQLGVEA